MSLSDLEHHVFAYWVAGQAKELNVAGRFYPHGELIMIVADKIEVATRKFGRKVSGKAKAAAAAFVEHMIAKGGWSTTTNDFGGTMHQFQPDAYRKGLAELQATDPVIRKAAGEGEGYWEKAFADLTTT